MRGYRRLLLLLLVPPLAALAQGLDTAWVRQFERPDSLVFSSHYMQGNDIVADGAGYVTVGGLLQNPASTTVSNALGTARYNRWGDDLNQRVLLYGVGGTGQNQVNRLAVDGAGWTWALAQVDRASLSGLDAVLIAKDSNPGWTTRKLDYGTSSKFRWPDDNVFYDFAFGPSGELYACGTCWDSLPGYPGTYNMYTVARLDTATGSSALDTVWIRRYVLDPDADYQGGFGRKLEGRFNRRGLDRHPDFFEDFYDWDNCATAISVTEDGDVFTTGFGYHGNREYQVWTMRHDSTGVRQWEHAYGYTTSDWDDAGFDIAVNRDGVAYVAGFLEPVDDGYDYAVLRYAWNAALPTNYRQNGGTWDGDDFATAICLDDATPQNVYVTGTVEYEYDWYQMITHKLSHNLDRRWGNAGAYFGDLAGDAQAYDICWVDGRVYITGQDSLGGLGRPGVMMTACYTDATQVPKVPEWARGYSHSRLEDLGTAVWATDSDHVYVTGQSYRYQGGYQTSSIPLIRYFWPDRDVRADSIIAPAGEVEFGVPLTPAFRVLNDGNDRALLTVFCRLEHGWTDSLIYSDTIVETTWLYPESSRVYEFAEWVPLSPGPVAVSCSLAWWKDGNPGNNTLRDTVLVVLRDAASTRILAPGPEVDSGDAVAPVARVHNFGNTTETFDVLFRVDDGYAETLAVTLAPGDSLDRAFPEWTALLRGDRAVSCTTLLDGDADPANDRVQSTVFVRATDAAVVELLEPTGNYQSGDSVAPRARWVNHGNAPVDVQAWALLDDPATDARVYAERLDVAALDPGADTVLVFPWYTFTVQGNWSCRCSTALAGDQHPGNDTLDYGFLVGGHPDIVAAAVLAPAGSVDTARAVVPRVRLRNDGDVRVPFGVLFTLLDPAANEAWRDTLVIPALSVGADTVVAFAEWPGTTLEGSWTARCELDIEDEQPVNDTVSRGFAVRARTAWPEGWREVARMPAGSRQVKDGGWLVLDPASGLVYAFRGNKTQEFFRYEPFGDTWTALEPVPLGGEGKPPRKGSRGAADGHGSVYATKGNNTFGFWRYDIATNSWHQLTDVPEGPRRKKVKGGTDLVHVETPGGGYLYLLKGYKTEFYRYDIATATWETLPDVPWVLKDKWDKGSWLVHDGEGLLYAHQAKYYDRARLEHQMFRYDLARDSWSAEPLRGMPLWGLHGGRLKKKKAKDGSAGVFYDGLVYALKGGNTQQFYAYDPARDTWTELDTVPTVGSTGRKKRVKHGADLVALEDALWALKGNKTDELWRYGFGSGALFATRPERSGAAGLPAGAAGFAFSVAPNPFIGRTALRYSLPRAGRVRLELFDAAGRRARTIFDGWQGAGAHSASLRDDGLAAGVYLARLTLMNQTGTRIETREVLLAR